MSSFPFIYHILDGRWNVKIRAPQPKKQPFPIYVQGVNPWKEYTMTRQWPFENKVQRLVSIRMRAEENSSPSFLPPLWWWGGWHSNPYGKSHEGQNWDCSDLSVKMDNKLKVTIKKVKCSLYVKKKKFKAAVIHKGWMASDYYCTVVTELEFPAQDFKGIGFE